MRTLPEILEAAVRGEPGRPAIVEGGAAVGYAELGRRVSALAEALRERGVGRGDRIGLLFPNGLRFVEGYFAILRLGAIAVPLSERYQRDDLLHLLDAAGVSRLLTARSFAPLCRVVLSRTRSRCAPLYAEDLGDIASPRPAPSAGGGAAAAAPAGGPLPDDPAMVQFSSGSTGQPKRILRTHAQLVAELDALVRTFGLTPEDRVLGVAPFSHVNGLVRSMLASVRAGATLHPLSAFGRNTTAEAIERHRLTVFIAVPFMFHILAGGGALRRRDLTSLRWCVSASAPLPPADAHAFRERFGVWVRQLYGSTETGTISVNLQPDVERSLASVGTPIAGVRVRVLDGAGQDALPGETGEMAVSSPFAIRAYEGPPEANRSAFRDGWFMTGDLGRCDAEGLLSLVGRRSFLINKGGFKIDPREIEALLESHPAVAEAVVVGMPAPGGDEKVKAVVVPRGSLTAAELLEHCRGHIAAFKIPTLVEFRRELPRSPAGKVRRNLLRGEPDLAAPRSVPWNPPDGTPGDGRLRGGR